MQICGYEFLPSNIAPQAWTLAGVTLGFLLSTTLQIIFRSIDKKAKLNDSAGAIIITTKQIIDEIHATKKLYDEQFQKHGKEELTIENCSLILPPVGSDGKFYTFDKNQLQALKSKGDNNELSGIFELERLHKSISLLCQKHEALHEEFQKCLSEIKNVKWEGNRAHYYPDDSEIAFTRPTALKILELLKLLRERLNNAEEFYRGFVPELCLEISKNTKIKSYTNSISFIE